MVEQRPFKPLVSGSSPDALTQLRGDSITAIMLCFKLSDGGSIPSPPANVRGTDVNWENGAVAAL